MEYSSVQVIESTVTICLPEWVCNEEYEQRRVFFNPPSHIYAGSYDRDKWVNMLEEELFNNIRGIQSALFHPMNCNIEVEVDDNTNISDIIRQIENLLDKWKDEEYRKENTRTRYYNHPDGLIYAEEYEEEEEE